MPIERPDESSVGVQVLAQESQTLCNAYRILSKPVSKPVINQTSGSIVASLGKHALACSHRNVSRTVHLRQGFAKDVLEGKERPVDHGVEPRRFEGGQHIDFAAIVHVGDSARYGVDVVIRCGGKRFEQSSRVVCGT